MPGFARRIEIQLTHAILEPVLKEVARLFFLQVRLDFDSVTLPNGALNKSPGTSGSCRCDEFTPCLQGDALKAL